MLKTPLRSNIANPQFHGDKEKLIQQVERRRVAGLTIPPCFSDPNLESGICNPHIPLRSGEPFLCSLHKTCLAAKLLAAKVPLDPAVVAEESYNALLARGDILFDQLPVSSDQEMSDRSKIRAHVVSVPMDRPANPFRQASLRRYIIEILSADWVSLADIRAHLFAAKFGPRKKVDAVIAQVTALPAQEHYGYRIFESFGKYKAVKR